MPDTLAFAADAGNASLATATTKLTPATRDCQQPFVVLVDAIPTTVPPGYAYPEITGALKAIELGEGKLVEARIGNKDVFGAAAESYESAEKIAQAVAASHKGNKSPPLILCGKPFITREVKVP